MSKLKDFRDLESLLPVSKINSSPPKSLESGKPKIVHYDVQRQKIKERIAEHIKIKQPILDIVFALKKEYSQVCKLEPAYVRAQFALIGMTTTNGDWRPFYISPEDFTRA